MKIKKINEEFYHEISSRSKARVSEIASLESEGYGKLLIDNILNLCDGDYVMVESNNEDTEFSLFVKMAIDVAKAGKKVLFFHDGRHIHETYETFLAHEALVNRYYIRTGHLNAAEWRRLAMAASELSKLPIDFRTAGELTDAECLGLQRSCEYENDTPYDCVFISNMWVTEKPGFHWQERIEREISILARRMGAVFVIGSAGYPVDKSRNGAKSILVNYDDTPEIDVPNRTEITYLEKTEYRGWVTTITQYRPHLCAFFGGGYTNPIAYELNMLVPETIRKEE